MKNLSYYLVKYKLAFILFSITIIITSSSVLALGKAVSYFVDYGLSDKKILLQSLLIFLFVIIILAIATFARFFLITYYGEKIICDIRKDLFTNLINLSASFFEKNKVGELISRVTSDLTILQSVLSSSVSIFLRNSLIFLGGVTILITINFKLTLLVFFLVPLIIFPLFVLAKKLKKLSRESQDRVSDMSFIMEENLSFVKLVQSFNSQDKVENDFTTSLIALLQATKARVLLRSCLTMLVIITVFLGVAVVLYQGAMLVLLKDITAGEFSEFLFYTILVAASFAALSEVFGSMQRAKGATERLFELINEKSSIIDGKKHLSIFKKLTFKNVNFCYPSRQEPSLKDLSFTINHGEMVALVGPSGAGKTTIFELLQRFYDITAGELLVNDLAIKQYSLKDLRNLFTIVGQENEVFSDTIKNNLLFAGNFSEQEMIKVTKKTMSYNFINKLPNKYDSFLGHKGVRLSSGERQRLSLSRAILRDSQIILLDEPTSNLDSHNEKLFQDFLEEYRGKKTIIIIAHRLSTIKYADKILVLDKGGIIQTGKNEDLMKDNEGLYKKLVNLQFDFNNKDKVDHDI
jgi:ATP-binding cassette subfamily B protein